MAICYKESQGKEKLPLAEEELVALGAQLFEVGWLMCCFVVERYYLEQVFAIQLS